MRNQGWLIGLVLALGCTESTRPGDPSEIAVRLSAASATSQQVLANNLVTSIPSVIAYDAKGAPVPGALVTFAIESGVGGTIEHSVDTTDAAGLAQIRLWRVGTKANVTNIVSARMVGRDPVFFSATVLPGPVAYLVKLDGDNQIVQSNNRVPVNPKAQVTDIYSNPISGLVLTASVTRGGGSIATSEVVTDSLGTVTISGWSAGAAGDQMLSVSTTGVTAFFHATAISMPTTCVQPTELIALTHVASQMPAGDCVRDGRYYTIYYINTPYAGTWSFEMKSTAFDSYLELRDITSKVIARNDNIDSSKDSRILAMIPAGLYQVVAISNTPGTAGQFGIAALAAQTIQPGCDGVFVTRGSLLEGVLHPLTCNGVFAGYQSFYRIHLEAGESVDVGLYDESYSGSTFAIVNDNSELLKTEEVPTQDFYYTERYTADKAIDILVRVTSTEDWAEYKLSFK